MISALLSDPWGIAIVGFLLLAPMTAVGYAMVTRPRFDVRSAGDKTLATFDGAPFIDQPLTGWLETHYKQTEPVLRVWQHRAWTFGWVHYYTVAWTTAIALSLPFLVQDVSSATHAKQFVQIISAFAAITYGMHSAFRVQQQYQNYRLCESSIYTLIRRMRSNPDSFGKTPEERFKKYCDGVEKIREQARSGELNHVPAPAALAGPIHREHS